MHAIPAHKQQAPITTRPAPVSLAEYVAAVKASELFHQYAHARVTQSGGAK